MAARGGEDMFERVETFVAIGTMSTPNREVSVKLLYKNTGLYRLDMQVQDKQTSRIYNANTGQGWIVDSIENTNRWRPLFGAALLDFKEQLDCFWPYYDYKHNKERITYLGIDKVQNITCYKLRIVLPSGHMLFQYIDLNSHLVIKQRYTGFSDNKYSIVEELISGYREVDGFYFPHVYDRHSDGDHAVLIIHGIVLNRPLDDKLFTPDMQR